MKLKRSLDIALVKASTGRDTPDIDEYGVQGKEYGCLERNPLESIIIIANTYNPDILIAPEFMFYDGKRILTEDEKKYIEARIAQEVQNKDMLVIPGSIMWHNPKEGGLVKNTSPIITDRRVIAEHMKASDGGCGKIAKEHGLGYAKGPEQGTTTNWKGLDIGLEICIDHGLGMLKKSGKQIDIHIVPASGMSHCYWNNCSKDNGYFILCDGFEEYSNKVLQRKGAEEFEPISPLDELSDSNADIYRIEAEVEEW